MDSESLTLNLEEDTNKPLFNHKVGVVCDLSYTRSMSAARNYHAISNLFRDVRIVLNSDTLGGLDILFIPDPFFHPHKIVWNNTEFINKCNQLGLKVVVAYGEKIKDSPYPEAFRLFETVKSFNNLTYYLWDVDDSLYFNRKIIRYCPSKFYAGKVEKRNNLDKCIFVGQINTPHYAERRDVLNTINNYIETDVVSHTNGDWKDYLDLYSNYKYSLCPISGNYNGLSLRFYESLLAGCIPIQQVRKNTLKVYSKESEFNDCIFFEKVEEIPEKLESLKVEKPTNMVWLEDELVELLKEDNVL
jgi:hypothetical protein